MVCALKKLQTWPLLNGFRGRPDADLEGIIQVVLAVAALIDEKRDEIVELEINPLMVKAENGGAVVADALVRIRALSHN